MTFSKEQIVDYINSLLPGAVVKVTPVVYTGFDVPASANVLYYGDMDFIITKDDQSSIIAAVPSDGILTGSYVSKNLVLNGADFVLHGSITGDKGTDLSDAFIDPVTGAFSNVITQPDQAVDLSAAKLKGQIRNIFCSSIITADSDQWFNFSGFKINLASLS